MFNRIMTAIAAVLAAVLFLAGCQPVGPDPESSPTRGAIPPPGFSSQITLVVRVYQLGGYVGGGPTDEWGFVTPLTVTLSMIPDPDVDAAVFEDLDDVDPVHPGFQDIIPDEVTPLDLNISTAFVQVLEMHVLVTAPPYTELQCWVTVGGVEVPGTKSVAPADPLRETAGPLETSCFYFPNPI